MFIINVYCFLFFAVFCSLIDGRVLHNNNNQENLELVHVLFRHGDRTPDKHVIYPNDPHINATYHPVGYGQLTNAGKRKEYLLGKALRKRYEKFLGNYNIDTIDARCTDYNRTKMSLQLVLASLFPPEDELIWEKKLKWQPIPFNYWPLKDDHVLGDPYKNCPRFKKLYHDFLLSTEGFKLYDNYTVIRDYLTKHAGINMTSKNMAELYFTITTEKENGLMPPKWTESVYPQVLLYLANLEYQVCTATSELKRLSSGFLFNKIISDTRQKIKGDLPRDRKMFLYSAHEYNLAYLLRFLGIYYPHVPHYGSYILIEIHNINGIRGVKVFYQDYKMAKPRRMKLPNCPNFCRFERFVGLFKQYLPQSEKECFT